MMARSCLFPDPEVDPAGIVSRREPMRRWCAVVLASLSLLLAPLPAGSAPPSGVSGYQVREVSLPPDLYPAAFARAADGTLYVASLNGQIVTVRDADGDGIPESFPVFASYFDNPIGLVHADKTLYVATRPALLALRDEDGDGRAEVVRNVSSDWNHDFQYHNYTFGLLRDAEGSLYGGLNCDFTMHWGPNLTTRGGVRGSLWKVTPKGEFVPLASGVRVPNGWAMSREGDIYFCENNGNQRLCSDILPLVPGKWYGYPAEEKDVHRPSEVRPAIRPPLSEDTAINGIEFLYADGKAGPFDGQMLVCYWVRGLVMRAQIEKVRGVPQGALYPFLSGFFGPMRTHVAPDGTIWVGGFGAAGWHVGGERGSLYLARYGGSPPFAVKETHVKPDGFELTFTKPVKPESLAKPDAIAVESYRHQFVAKYHPEVVERAKVGLKEIAVKPGGDGTVVTLKAAPLGANREYEFRLAGIEAADGSALTHEKFWYTMNELP